MESDVAPPGDGIAGGVAKQCTACGAPPRTVSDVADLDVLWLVPGLGGAPAPGRYCRACRPGGPVADHACEMCGNGPLLAGELAGADDLITSAAVADWLAATGWRGDGRWCPSCAAPSPASVRSRAGGAGAAG